MKKRTIIGGVAAVGVIAIIATGCNGDNGTVSGSASSASSAASDPVSSGSADASSSAAAPSVKEQATNPKFGQTYTWKDGNAVTISTPESFTPSSSYVAQLAPNAKGFEVVTVTAKNGTQQPMNPMEVSLQATSGGQQAQSVFDAGGGINLPTADIQPGQTLTWKAVFGEVQPGDLQVQASVGFIDGGVQFTR